MINWKMIYKIMGFLLFIEAGFLSLCIALSAFYQEPDLPAFIISTLITIAVGIPLSYAGKQAERKLSRKDGYVVVTFAWILFSLFGMLPYYISGYIPNLTNAYFETMSGFTTTGASILNNIEAFPHGLLFWRSMTQWIGGMGIVIFTIAVLPIFGVGGIQLFAAEATGPKFDKITPRIDITAKWIWTIYFGLTIAETVLLMAGDMPLFDTCIVLPSRLISRVAIASMAITASGRIRSLMPLITTAASIPLSAATPGVEMTISAQLCARKSGGSYSLMCAVAMTFSAA